MLFPGLVPARSLIATSLPRKLGWLHDEGSDVGRVLANGDSRASVAIFRPSRGRRHVKISPSGLGVALSGQHQAVAAVLQCVGAAGDNQAHFSRRPRFDADAVIYED